MTKTYILENLDCANCAAKMERKVGKIKGVESCTVTFMTKKMTIEADEAAFEDIMKIADKEIHKVDKAVVIQEARR